MYFSTSILLERNTATKLTQSQIYFKRESFDYSVSKESPDLLRRKRQSSGSATAGSAARNVWLPDLVPGERYSFQIRSANEMGMESEWSDSVSTVTQTGISFNCS